MHGEQKARELLISRTGWAKAVASEVDPHLSGDESAEMIWSLPGHLHPDFSWERAHWQLSLVGELIAGRYS